MMRRSSAGVALVSLLTFGGCGGAPEARPAPGAVASLEAAERTSVPREVERPEYERFFAAEGVEGAFVLYDLGADTYVRHDPERAARRFIPASTFKIFNSLVALETGVLADENEIIRWDGVDRGWEMWNRDHSMRSAFPVSAVWFYQEVARRIGEERMREWIARAGYGNGDLGGGIDTFWLTGDLRISPEEQVIFLRRLYQDQLPFSPRSMRIVREVMYIEGNESYTLRGKTGWGRLDGANYGWLVGYVERGDNVYFFATSFEGRGDLDVRRAQQTITRGILGELGLLEGAAPSGSP